MDVKKRPWVKPQLIVLGRGRPEESVLANCKTNNQTGGGPNGILDCISDGDCSPIGTS
jgi:hypothetical protein